ncbi:MAG: carbamoyltransferase [bacterium]
MYVLGITATMNDPAACLIKNGKVVTAIEEERLTRYKFEKGFPHRAVDRVLKIAGISLQEVDYIGYTWLPYKYLGAETLYRFSRLPFGPRSSMLGFVNALGITASHLHDLWTLQRETGKRPISLNHHLCHLASSFLGSPFEEAAILSVDNRGEDACTVMATGRGRKIKIVKTIRIPHSLGKVYSGMTHHLGFRPEKDEYKVMGMASYGQPVYYDILKKMIILQPDGGYRINHKLCNLDLDGRPTGKLISLIAPPRHPHAEITREHKNLAASLQKVHEEVILHLARYLRRKSGLDNLCLAGGVSYNSVANGRIREEAGFREVYLPPCVGDSGTAFGAAFYIYNAMLNKERAQVIENAYFGSQFSNKEIQEILDICKLPYRKTKDIAKDTAILLAEGNIFGWFQGGMEFGPRALGARSILADPRREDMQDLVNKYVKRREEFRPFAPSVKEEACQAYFEADYNTPFMTSVCRVKRERQKELPATTHVDGTARVQTVNRNSCPLYWKLLDEFEKITGIPVLLNTSFNVRDEPIVASPYDAVSCFASSGIDYLAVGDFLVSKKQLNKN